MIAAPRRTSAGSAPLVNHPGVLSVPPAIVDQPLRFDHFELHPAERVLRVRGEPVALGSRAFDLLLALAQRHERLVTKQELLDLVWPGLVVEEHNIATQISTLRKLLGASAITTLPGYGYRLTAVRAVGAGCRRRWPRAFGRRRCATTCRSRAPASSGARRRWPISRACCLRRGC